MKLSFRAHLATLPRGPEVLALPKFPSSANTLHHLLSWADRERPDLRDWLKAAHADYRAMKRARYLIDVDVEQPELIIVEVAPKAPVKAQS